MATKKKTSAAAPTTPVPSALESADNYPRVAAAKVPEVKALLDLEQELTALKADYPDVFAQYKDLADRYNAALDAADKAVRAKKVSCGPFDNFTSTPSFDPEKMYEELGVELFLQCGGSTKKKTVYEVDKHKVEAAIATGQIPVECAKEFRTVKRSFHKPKELIV